MITYEYGAMSSKYSLQAANKFIAYATMVYHYDRQAHLIMIYTPVECKEDVWTAFDGKISERLDEIFAPVGGFDKYVEEHIEEVRECMKTIAQVV